MQKDKLPVEDDVIDQSVCLNTLSWTIKIFLLSLLIPTEASFNLGEFRLTVYRLVLLSFFLPCAFRVLSGRRGHTLATDWFLLSYSFWIVLALTVHLGFFEGLKSGGILVVESFGAYLLARSFIRTEFDFGCFVKFLVFVVVCLSLVTIPESLTGKNILRPYLGHLGGRLGLTRAFGPFDHPILYGVFCASAVSLAYYVPSRSLLDIGLRNKFRAGWVVIAAFMSISSGALAAVVVQIILMVWKRLTQGVESQWRLFSYLIVVGYFLIDLFSNRTPIKVLLHRLTFSAETAYARLLIWEWGTKYNVAEHPWFGIGFAEWVRAPWMGSTIDNYWLVNMVRYGLPSFFLLAAAGLLLLFAVKQNSRLSESAKLMRTGWGFAMIGFIVAGCTVHFWNSLHVWFFFLLGSGAWMASYGEE